MSDEMSIVRKRTLQKASSVSPEDAALAESMGLPRDYFGLGPAGQKKARMASLASWFDPSKPHVLCTSVDKFVRACKLWVEFYYKPDEWNAGTYHFADPSHKYDMVRAAVTPAKVWSLPGRALVSSTRGSTKTQTLIQEMVPMMAVCRPHSSIVVSEMNAQLTVAQIRGIKLQIENNERIRADFGTICPHRTTATERWNEELLMFTHHRSQIAGVSVNSAHRGKHIPFGIIDDPEDDDTARSPTHREKFFEWLFHTYMPMFGPGGNLLWIGTPISGPYACLPIAMAGDEATKVDELNEEEHTFRDVRFDDWSKVYLSVYYEEDGVLKSRFPDKYPAEHVDSLKKSMGLQGFMAEIMLRPIGSGMFVFKREKAKHGFMRCRDKSGDDYFFDCKTGIRKDWKTWVASLHIVGAVDLADSVSATACPGAIVIVGVGPDGVIYVLDVFNRKCHADTLVHKAFDMAAHWDAEVIGWETNAMQTVVVRYAKNLGEELRAKGQKVPLHRAIRNIGKDKIRRILAAMTKPMQDYKMRFMEFDGIVDAEGVAHEPATSPSCAHHELLKQQVDLFTDRGGSGYVDAIDALEMAIRVAGNSTGVAGVEDDGCDMNALDIEEWAKAGVEITPAMLPLSAWPLKWLQEARTPKGIGIVEEVGDTDPYDVYNYAD